MTPGRVHGDTSAFFCSTPRIAMHKWRASTRTATPRGLAARPACRARSRASCAPAPASGARAPPPSARSCSAPRSGATADTPCGTFRKTEPGDARTPRRSRCRAPAPSRRRSLRTRPRKRLRRAGCVAARKVAPRFGHARGRRAACALVGVAAQRRRRRRASRSRADRRHGGFLARGGAFHAGSRRGRRGDSMPQRARYRSASSAAMQPMPAAVTAWR